MRTLVLLLTVVASTQAQDKPGQIHLNHAYITPDAETYEAIRNSDFVRQFAVWQERTTHRKDMSYTGFYLYGRHTYFEFLKPSDAGKGEGSQIAFGVDEASGLEALQKRAQAAGMKTEIVPITRDFNGKDVAWFKMLQRTDKVGPSVGIWTLEYEPTFLTEWSPRPDAKGGIRREDVQARYAEVVKQNSEEKLMADITDVWINVPRSSLSSSKEECKVLGMQVWSKDTGLVCASNNFKIHVLTGLEQPGVVAFGFSLTEAAKTLIGQAKTRTIWLGKSALSLTDRYGRWDFRGIDIKLIDDGVLGFNE